MSSSAPAIRSASSWRCWADIDRIIRSAAAARRASESTSSSRFAGLSGNMSPCFDMNSSKSSWVCSPRSSAASIALRSAIMSLMRCIAAGSGFSSASFMPRNCVSSTSRRSRSFTCSKVCAASGDFHS